MNSWTKSIIIGAIAAIAVYFISEVKDSQLRAKKYMIGCTIHAEPDTTSKVPFSLSRIMEVMKNRLEAANYKYEINKTDKNNIIVSLSGVTDTLSPFSMLISNGRVQFREMYRIGDANIAAMLVAAVNEMNSVKDSSEEEITVIKKDSVSKDVSALIDSMESYKKKEKTVAAYRELIQFYQPYNSDNTSTSFSTAIGAVKVKDTAAVRALLNLDKIKTKAPSDLQICFGEIDKSLNKNQRDWFVSLFFIKTYGNEKALLENEDIEDANAVYNQYQKPEITLQFNRYGTIKWANLTQKNIGRPLAIILNGRVISAPNVAAAIPNGASTISGSFTYDECKLLSIQLKSNKLPAKLSIVSSSVKRDTSDYHVNRKLLVAFISFVVAAGIAFFIFKTLKAT